MPQTFETLRTETPQEHTLLVTLHRPEAANAMNTQLGRDLLSVIPASQQRGR